MNCIGTIKCGCWLGPASATASAPGGLGRFVEVVLVVVLSAQLYSQIGFYQIIILTPTHEIMDKLLVHGQIIIKRGISAAGQSHRKMESE